MDQAMMNKIGYGLGGVALLFAVGVGAYALGSRGKAMAQAEPERRQEEPERSKPDRSASNASSAPSSAAASAPSKHPVLMAKSLEDAIKIAAPSDSTNDNDPGTLLLTGWAHLHMTLESVKVTQDETTFGRVMKDPDEERGKRACFSGSIVQIDTERVREGEKIYVGMLMTGSVNVVRFYAVGSSGDLVARHSARFCGVVTGRYSYANAAGGSTHAVAVVGLFDLPENKDRVLPRL